MEWGCGRGGKGENFKEGEEGSVKETRESKLLEKKGKNKSIYSET